LVSLPPIGLISWRKTLLVVAGVLVFGYAVAVVCYVPSTPDIGIRCAFTPVIKQVTLPPDKDGPVVDDELLQVGNYRFPDKAQPQFWAQVQLLRRLIVLRGGPPPDTDPPVMRTNEAGQKEVLVKYWSKQADQEKEVWCALRRMPLSELIPSILWFFLKLGLFLVGALVFWKRPGDQSAAHFFLLCIVTLGAFMGGYHWNRIATQPALLLPFMLCAVLLPAVTLHFYLVFPRPKTFLQRRPGWTALAIYGVPAGFLTVLVVSYFHLRSVRDGAGESAAWDLFSTEALSYLAVAPLWYLASVVGLVHSFRTAANATERNQVKWILAGSVLALVPIGYTLFLLSWNKEDFGAGAGTWPMFTASVCFTAAFAISITRYRLMQLDQILTSGMVYFVLSFLAGMVYYVVVFVGMLVSGVIRAPSFTEALSFTTTVLVFLLLLDVVRGRLKKVLDRRFAREKHQLDRTLRRMGQAIEQLVDPPTLARRLLQASAELLNVSRGAVYLREGEAPVYHLVDSLGAEPPPLAELSPGCPLVEALQTERAVLATPGLSDSPARRQLRLLGGQVAFALAHEDRLLAFLILGPRDLGWYGQDDLNLLAAFSQLTSLALENAQGHHTIELLTRDLQAKVEKISEQQRRILALQNQLMNRTPPPEPPAEAADAVLTPPPAGRTAPAGIVGSGLAMRQVLEMVRKAAASPSAVLICGESGTGKELLARALHDQSPRADKPYVKVHCAALSPNLLESELFGHVKGAFTGAHRDKVGRFELANGGTLFLDEIGDVSLDVQTKLLRVLQEKTFERVGSSVPVEVDVRVIAATHQDLEDLMRQGRFRQDLYFRLKVIPLTVPPLRERREDIPELVLHFLRLYAKRCNQQVAHIEDDALVVLKSYDWPGNVRELENVIERAVVVAEGPAVTVADLPPEILQATDGNGELAPDEPAELAGGIPAERAEHSRRERERLVRALAAAGGNKAEAARALGLKRSTLVSRLKKYGLS
jgi:transcriptional regulator with GAF, ATPase, and Fis domain